MVRGKEHSGHWLVCRRVRTNPTLRLFCVPFAGAGAALFNAWGDALPDTIEVQAVRLPGRESRYGEVALTDAYEAAHLLAGAMEPRLDRPYAVFGYSMGALIGFEVIRELRRRGAPMPVHFFVGASRAPQVAATRPAMAQLPRDLFLQRITEYYDPPAVALPDTDLIDIVLPVIRADIALCERYAYRSDRPFDFPIQAFAGRGDQSVSLAEVQAWQGQTFGHFALEIFEGTHFFLIRHLGRVQELVRLRLEHALGDAV